MGKVRTPVSSHAPRRTLHLVPTGANQLGGCIRCGADLVRMGAHYTDDGGLHQRIWERGTMVLQLDTVDAAYEFDACRGRR